MANLFRQNPLAFALAVVAAALAAVIVVEVALSVWPQATAESAKPAPTSDARMLPPIAAVTIEAAYPETAARPLFTPTRRPAPVAAATGTMVKGQFVLQGVIAVGEKKIAILREKTSGKVHRVERGKEVNGVTLSAVEPEKVTLAQGGDEEVLTLQVAKASAPAPGAGGAPGATAAAPHAAGPFAPSGQPAPPGQAAAVPTPAPNPTPAPPAAVAQPAPPASNPAQRSAFGPFPQPAPGEAAQPMTPEELLARRRARRTQTTPQPNQ